ncbi:MAG: hypothetical protein HY929_08345 [Euryarchaeota archaeon]|nr:hypothetical protein [Euryarchaeota archaeon]
MRSCKGFEGNSGYKQKVLEIIEKPDDLILRIVYEESEGKIMVVTLYPGEKLVCSKIEHK